MFAVIRTGGKQYKVAAGDVIRVERLAGEVGQAVELDQVLMIGNGKETTVGSPRLEGASVSATVVDQTRGDKIVVFKKKRRKGYRRRHGHRQDLTVLQVTDIHPSGAPRRAAKAEPAKPAAKAAPEKKPAAPAAEKAAKPAPAKKKAAPKPAAKKTAAKPAAKAKGTAKKTKTTAAKPAAEAKAKAPAKKGAAKTKTGKKGKEGS